MKVILGIAFLICIYCISSISSSTNDELLQTSKVPVSLNANVETRIQDRIEIKNDTKISDAKNSTKNIIEISKSNKTLGRTVKISIYDTINRLYYNQLSRPIKTLSNYKCRQNDRYCIPKTCNKYIECKDGNATILECIDGLHFDPNRASTMPCQYSADVSCDEEKSAQFGTKECPRKFGYFKLEDKYNCSSFRICEFGSGYDFQCPNGLAFRSDTLRCDWPHKVPECNAEAYAGFQCPDKEINFKFYGSPTDCQVYYTCIYGVPRRQNCNEFMGFNGAICVPAYQVGKCDPYLKLLATKNKIDLKETDYDDGDGYFHSRNTDLSLSRRTAYKAKIISYPNF